MSAIKKLLFGGATAGLALSLMLPTSSSTLGPSESQGAAGPRFSKPWLKKSSSPGRTSLFGFLRPSQNDQQVTPERTDAPADVRGRRDDEPQSQPAQQPAQQPAEVPGSGSPAGQSNVMRELEELYRRDGKQPPQMSGQTFEQSPTEQPQSEAAPQAAARQPKRERSDDTEEKSSKLSDFFDKIVGSPSPKTFDDPNKVPEFNSKNAAKLGIKLADDPAHAEVREYDPAPEPMSEPPAQVVDVPSVPQSKPKFDEMPLPIPMPPAPQTSPSKTEIVATPPAASAFPKSEPQPSGQVNLPFLPPLPAPIPDQKSLADAAPVEPPGVVVLPPLPGEELLKPEVQEPVLVESPTLAPVPDSEPVQTAEAPQMLEPVPSEMREPREFVADSATELRVDESPVMKPEITPDAELADITEPTLKGERKADLPLAPSVTAPVRRTPAPQQELAMSDTGWRSRQPSGSEPNQLAIPETAKPAQVEEPKIETQVAETPARGSAQQKYQLIAARGNATGFKGFCPVELRDNLELVDATPQFETEHAGQIYYFSSQQAREKFDADPIRYVPAHGGCDVVKFVQEGMEEAGRLDYAVWYQDRLFLFSNRETMLEFRATPESFVK
ncbi:hypothetical protein [Rubinisphaera margarita]|uniref:hypothetical protein n=1 Tax=Rubinisphaera margarita TaxID=2909586 RepID=UPI001EE982E9|nr:hypothetical protein [Rubinisphaera margarita]MCG6157612.1 hypothetical protein [Rubinisphaera margarita]